MIDITRAQANQATIKGINEDWIVTLDSEVLYKLPAHFTVQETFLIRDIIENMIKIAVEEATAQEQQLNLVKMKHVVAKGDAQLDALKRENMRLSNILEQHLGAV